MGRQCERLTPDRTLLALRAVLERLHAQLQTWPGSRNFAAVARITSGEKQYALARLLTVPGIGKARIASGGRHPTQSYGKRGRRPSSFRHEFPRLNEFSRARSEDPTVSKRKRSGRIIFRPLRKQQKRRA